MFPHAKTYLFIVCCLVLPPRLAAQAPPAEFRAAWLTTLKNIDWPKTADITPETPAAQQAELTGLLDRLQAGNINAVCFQARPSADALYSSPYEPWSPVLTGIRGQDPGYDPLRFVIEQAHARGMELHAWVNPFRYERNAGERVLDIEACMAAETSDPIRLEHPEWLLTYHTAQYQGSILDPGHPDARAYVLQVITDLIRRYDIDGLVMDDYFYPYGGTNDEDLRTRKAYQPDSLSVGDWRRACVNEVIRAIHDTIRAVKPGLRFGMSPFGIYSMTDSAASRLGLTLPQGISGTDAWADLYCDPLEWVAGGYVDYLAPQLYWSTKATRQNYETLCSWWCRSVATLDSIRADGKQTHVYISHASYRFGAEELGLQIDLSRKYAPHNAPGCIFYNTNQYLNFTGGRSPENSCDKLRRTHFTESVPTPVPLHLTPAVTAPVLQPDSMPYTPDTLDADWQGSRFHRTTLRQQTDF